MRCSETAKRIKQVGNNHDSVKKVGSGFSSMRLSLLLVLLVVLVYSGKFSNQLVWDDLLFISGGEAKHELSAKAVLGYFAEPVQNIYRPGRSLLYAIAYQIGGTEPIIYHLIGLLLHIGCVLVVFRLAALLFSSPQKGFIASALFAVHPMGTERVAFISASFDLAGPLLYLCALVFFIRYLMGETERPRFLFFSGALFISGLFCSEEVMVFPLVAIAVVLLVPSNRNAWKKWGGLGVFFTLLIAFLIFRYEMIGRFSRVSTPLHPDPWRAFYTFVGLFARYLKMFVVPKGQRFIYDDITLQATPLNAWTLIGLFLAISALIAIVLFRKKSLPISFGLVMGGLSLAPYTNLVPTASLFAERYFYMSSIGFTMAGTAILLRVPLNYRLKSIFFILLVSVLAVLSIVRVPVWQDQLSLFGDAYSKAPQSAIAQNNYADALDQEGQRLFNLGRLEAKDYFFKSIAVKSRAKGHLHLAMTLYREKDVTAAEKHFLKALYIEPQNAVAVRNYSSLLMEQNRWAEARDFLKSHIRKDGTDEILLMRIGIACQKNGLDLADCLSGHPINGDYRILLGFALAAGQGGNIEKEKELLRQYLRENPEGNNAEKVCKRLREIEEN